MNFPTEAQEARTLMYWAKFHPICREYLIHIPNGGSRKDAREGANLKAQGVRPGVSDYFLAYPSKKYHGLWLELKRKNPAPAVLTAAQKDWLNKMNLVGYDAQLVYGWEAAKKIIEEYLSE